MKERISEYMSRYLRRDEMLGEDATTKMERKILETCCGNCIEVNIGNKYVRSTTDGNGHLRLTFRKEKVFRNITYFGMLDSEDIEWLADNYKEIIRQFEEKVLRIKEEKKERMNKRMNAMKKLEKAMEEGV